MDFSVLLSVYKNDSVEELRQALDSIFNQTLLANEVILVCDGPLSNELDKLIDQYGSNHCNFKIVRLEKNVGLGKALNAGIMQCRYPLIVRMDADDICFKNRFECLVGMFDNDPQLDIAGSPVIEFIGHINNTKAIRDVPKSNEEIYKYAKYRDPFNHPAVAYKKNKVVEVGGYGNYRKNQDTDLWIKLLSNNCKCANYPEPLLYFRFDEQTYKRRKSWLNTKLLLEIRYKAVKRGFNSYFEFITIFISQLLIYCMPTCLQKIIYKRLLRK